MKLSFTLNGAQVEVDAPPAARLLDVLREQLGATGTKEGCGEGECGACSVLIDGRSVCACLVPAVQIQDATCLTVEGLAEPNGELHPVQQAFLKHGAAQCGICTPGLLITAAELHQRGGSWTRSEVREALAGNLCRCTGYQKIVDAVAEVVVVES